MSNEYDYEEDFESENETNAPKELRSLVKKQNAELKELKSKLESYETNERKANVATILKEKGINEEVAKFVPSDLQTEETVTAWLEENGGIFGYNPTATTTQTTSTSTPVKPANNIADLQSMALPADIIKDLNQRIANAKTKEEFDEALKAVHNTIIK